MGLALKRDKFADRGYSYNEAAQFSPLARRLERDALLKLSAGRTKVTETSKVADWQAAGGYLAAGLVQKGFKHSQIVCVEPSDELVCGIDRKFNLEHSALDNTSLQTQSLDAVFCLAGLHHNVDKAAIFREVHRVLKPGGWFYVAEVETGSRQDFWLNDFVGRHNSTGHDGTFVKLGDLSALGEDSGFLPVVEKRQDVPWIFESESSMVEFCKKIFGLRTTSSEIHIAIAEYLQPENHGTRVVLPWSLNYAAMQKN